MENLQQFIQCYNDRDVQFRRSIFAIDNAHSAELWKLYMNWGNIYLKCIKAVVNNRKPNRETDALYREYCGLTDILEQHILLAALEGNISNANNH